MLGQLSLKGIVLAALMQAQKAICAAGGEGGIDPHFRIMTPEGDYMVSMPIAEDASEHQRQTQLLSKFMASKAVHVFTVAGQLADPDAVYVFGASHERQAAAVALIERGSPLRFGAVEWLAPEEIADEILALFPRGDLAPDTPAAELDAYFGAHGKFPAVRLGGGDKIGQDGNRT
jgi:hypothetical protein